MLRFEFGAIAIFHHDALVKWVPTLWWLHTLSQFRKNDCRKQRTISKPSNRLPTSEELKKKVLQFILGEIPEYYRTRNVLSSAYFVEEAFPCIHTTTKKRMDLKRCTYTFTHAAILFFYNEQMNIILGSCCAAVNLSLSLWVGG